MLTWSHFIQDKLKIYICLSWDKYKQIKANAILFHLYFNYHELNSQCHVVWKIGWTLFSIEFISDFIFITVFKEFMHDSSKVRAKLSSLCIICSLRQVNFSAIS